MHIMYLKVLLLFSLFLPEDRPGQLTLVDANLSHSSVTQIVQDDYGFIWVATRYGLNRYKGQEFEQFIYTPGDTTTILNSNISDIKKDKRGNIWIATIGGGLTCYDIRSDSFKTYLHDAENPNSIGDNVLSSICILNEDHILIGTVKNGLNLFNIKTEKFYRYRHNPNDRFSLSSDNISVVHTDTENNIWVGTWDSGINLFDVSTSKFYRYNLGQIEVGLSNVVRTMENTSAGILVGTDQGLYQLSKINEDFAFNKLNDGYTDDKPVISLLDDGKNGVWIGTENFGLYHFSKNKKLISWSMKNNSIWSIFKDQLDVIWIGTFNNGVYKIDPFENKFSHVKREPSKANTLSFNTVSSFYEDSNNNLWIGTDGGGLNFYNTSERTFSRYENDFTDPSSISSNSVLDIVADSSQNIWIATWHGGVNMKKPDSDSFYHLNTSNGLLSDDVFDLAWDQRGQLWITSFRAGINIYDPQSGEFDYIRQEALGSNKIRTILQDSRGYIWLGSEGDGLFRIRVDESNKIVEKNHFSNDKKHEDGLGDNFITYLHEGRNGILWVGTQGGGLSSIKLDNLDVKTYTKRTGLTSNVIYGILEDSQGNLWLSSGDGINKLTPGNGQVKSYNESDGLQSGQFFKGACYKSPEGELFFGGINGYNHFSPKNVISNNNLPESYITNLKINNKEYRGDLNVMFLERLELAYNENDLRIKFCALNYSQPEKTQYKYMLVGFDDHWVDASDIKEAIYTNVPSGSYEFMVKASNNDGLWNDKVKSMHIEIEKAWWRTTLSYLIYAFAIFGLIWLWRTNIINRERLSNELKIEHLELQRMKDMDAVKSQFFTNISHDFKTPLTLILDPLKSLNESISGQEPKNQLRIISRNAELLFRLVNRLLEISRLESKTVKLRTIEYDISNVLAPIAFSFNSYADRQFINYKCVFPDERIMVYFEKDKLEKVVLNLLSNAFKFTPEYGTIIFSVFSRDDSVEITVQDDGIGIPIEDQANVFDRFYRVGNSTSSGTGVGLALVKEIVDLHKGTVSLYSKENEGATFTVTLLKGTEHLSTEEIVETEVEGEENHIDDMVLHEPYDNQDYSNVEMRSQLKDMPELPLLLVAEDNYEMRSYICKYLESNYRIMEAENGQKALELAQNSIPDLIISDVAMPELDGYSLCDAIKNDERTSHIPLILLTGKASDENVKEGFSHGADYYITKPFNTKLLELRIHNILKSKVMLRKKILDEHSKNVELKDEILTTKDKVFIDKVVACIEDRISDSDFQIDDLCREIGMSRMQLYRKLKGTVGQSANEFIRTIRLKRAAQLLRHESITIAEVTYQVGFTDLHYFRSAFKKQFGVNPSEYKENVI